MDSLAIMEMEEITVEEGKVEEKAPEKKAEEGPYQEANTEENIYSKLTQSSEDVYTRSAEAKSLPSFHKEDAHGRLRLYRGMSVILLLLVLLLFGVVIVLGVKLSQSECPSVQGPLTETCSLQRCQDKFPPAHRQSGSRTMWPCSGCLRGWVSHEKSCYFLSQNRLTWEESRKECVKRGGDLVVIDNESLQIFLTKRGPLTYWIGLSSGTTSQWTWVNQDALIQSYWAKHRGEGHCALLVGEGPANQSWISSTCSNTAQYICQARSENLQPRHD